MLGCVGRLLSGAGGVDGCIAQAVEGVLEVTKAGVLKLKKSTPAFTKGRGVKAKKLNKEPSQALTG